MSMDRGSYALLAGLVLATHLTWIAWVIFGAALTRNRRKLACFHIASLIYSVVIDAGPWPCPLTRLEQALQTRAGMTPYRQSFLVHYLEAVVYPDVPEQFVTYGAIGVGVANGLVYGIRSQRRRKR